jgi:hypothetical protein
MSIIATVSLIDSYARPTTKKLETETSVLADAQTAVTGLLTDLNAITDLQCVGVSYSLKDGTQIFAGVAGSNVDVGATFKVRLADGTVAAYKVPGFPAAKVGPSGEIDVTDADVVAYFDNFLAAGDFTLSDGEVITEIVSGSLDR